MRPVVLGGGPAGCAAAIALARAGVRATVLERSREDEDALCGGFLSWRTLRALAAIGIAADDLSPAPVPRVRLFAGSRTSEAALPAPARGVSRRRLDALLRDRASTAGAGIERGVIVREVGDGGVRLADGAVLRSDTVILATGKHDIRGLTRPVGDDDPSIGLRLRIPAGPALSALVGDAVELHLFDGGYAGLVIQEDGSGNLCLAVRRSRLTAAGSPAALMTALADAHPHLGARLAGAPSNSPIDAVANIPYGWRASPRPDLSHPDLYRTGDQAAVIPSLAGEGMAIALASGRAAAHAILADRTPRDYQAAIAAEARRPLAIAGMVRALAERPATAQAMVATSWPPLVRAVARLTRFDDRAPALVHPVLSA